MTLSAGTKPSGEINPLAIVGNERSWNRHRQPKIKGHYRRHDERF